MEKLDSKYVKTLEFMIKKSDWSFYKITSDEEVFDFWRLAFRKYKIKGSVILASCYNSSLEIIKKYPS